jgi:hypothetical protein
MIKRKKTLGAVAALLCLTLLVWAAPAAAQTYAEAIQELSMRLENTYGFELKLDTFTEDEYAAFREWALTYEPDLPLTREVYTYNILRDIERHFPTIPFRVVNHMNRVKKLVISVELGDREDDVDGIYYPEENTIVLAFSGKYVVHEYGHLVHYALLGLLGKDAFKEKWLPLNQGVRYGHARPYSVYDPHARSHTQTAIFYGNYSTVDLYEDVAETFFLMTERPGDLRTLAEANAPLAQKAELLNELMNNVLLSTTPATVAEAVDRYVAAEVLSNGAEDDDAGDGAAMLGGRAVS